MQNAQGGFLLSAGTREQMKKERKNKDPQNWVGALPAKLFLTKPMYFNALKKR